MKSQAFRYRISRQKLDTLIALKGMVSRRKLYDRLEWEHRETEFNSRLSRHGGWTLKEVQSIGRVLEVPIEEFAEPAASRFDRSDQVERDVAGVRLRIGQFYSCFISYSGRNQDFAERLHADLRNNGIRCWFAPHDMPIGGKILDEIDSAIRLRDKMLLILSEHSIKSDWVEDEVTKAFEEERRHNKVVLFPIRLDDEVMDANEAWAGKLRARHIGDFRHWQEDDEYQKSFARVLRDLTVKKME